MTGGEPLLQVDKKLVKILQKNNFHVALETNGSIQTDIVFDWVCVSPKSPNHWNLKKGDELKVIYPQDKFDLKKLVRLDFKYFFLQPKYDRFLKINLNKTIAYCRLNKRWSPSFQVHKIIGVQ